MKVYLGTSDSYFYCGLESECRQRNIDIIAIGPDDIQTLSRNYQLHESDTLIIALDMWRGHLMKFIASLKILSSLNIKTILVSEGKNHIRRAGGYQLSKSAPLSEYMKIFLLPRQTFSHTIKALPLSNRECIMLDVFYRGVDNEEIRSFYGENIKKLYRYRALILRQLGIRRLNYLYQMF